MMHQKVIIINGPSCAGKSTISKEILKKSDKFVHLQIDRTVEFASTIFPINFKFVKNEDLRSNEKLLSPNFDHNRLSRRKTMASILLETAKELIEQSFDVVIDTALDGPDAKTLAKYYLKRLKNFDIRFVGIYCPLEERLKRLKTRKDNLFLTEKFVIDQTYEYNVFELCRKIYDIWYDSSIFDGETIAEKILDSFNN